jgi:hypothetical protein
LWRWGVAKRNPTKRHPFTKLLTLAKDHGFIPESGNGYIERHKGDKVHVTWTPGLGMGLAYVQAYDGKMYSSSINDRKAAGDFKNWPPEWKFRDEQEDAISNPDPGIKFVLGIDRSRPGSRGGVTEVQSVLFDKGTWSLREAVAWLKSHDLKYGSPDSAGGYHRFRQEAPGKFQEFRTIDASEGNGAMRNPMSKSDWGQQAFDAGKQYRISGDYYTSGVANARVVGYGFSKWFNDFPPGTPPRGVTRSYLEKSFREGYAAGKRVEGRRNPETITAVMFRKWPKSEGGDVIALFPEELADLEGNMNSYQHIGQHGAASPDLIYHTKKATPAEYADLKEELESIGYRLRIVQRDTGRAKRMAEAHKGLMRNPESASAMYESFHGAAPTAITEIREDEQYPDDLAQLGTLVELKVATVNGLDATIGFDGAAPNLASNAEGTQLYFLGGDQSLDLGSLKLDGKKWLKELMVIGVLYELTYRTAKGFHKFKVSDYYHELGEETGVQPMLNYDTLNAHLSVVGGQYHITDRGIEN